MRQPASLAGLALVLCLQGCGDSTNDRPPTPRSASFASAIAKEAETIREIVLDGTVEAINQATVSAQTSGRIEALPYDVGDFVAQGTLIVKLTDKEQRARLEAAEANVREARARATEAQTQFNRTREIFARKLVAKAQFDTAQANLNAANARLDQAQGALKEAQETARYTEIRAPYAGIVVARHVEVGEAVSVGQALMTGLSLDQLRVAVNVPAEHIAEVRRFRRARIMLNSGDSVPAATLRLPPQADLETHTFRVLASLPVDLPRQDLGLLPGTLAKVAFVTGTQRQLLLPDSAIVKRGELRAVYVADDGHPTLRYVRLGDGTADQQWPVLTGLVTGERYLTSAREGAALLASSAD